MRRDRAGRPWVLVTDGAPDDGQSRTTLWTARALDAAGYRTAVTVSGRFSLAAASRACRRTVRVPALHDPAAGAPFAAAISDELRRNRYLTVLPTSDPALMALGWPVEHLVDKASLTGLAERAGIPTPPTRVFDGAEALREASSGFSYPVVVKPAMGHGAARADRPADLTVWDGEPGPLLVQPYVAEGLRAVAGLVWNGEMVGAVHQRFLRTWPVAAGMTCAAVSIEADPALEARLLHLLAGYNGIFQADLAGPFLLDVNPRSFASLSLAMASGVNLAGMYCDLLMGHEPVRARGRPGVFYRWLDADVRYAVSALRQRRISAIAAIGMLAPRRNTARGGPESLVDPGPAFARLGFLVSRALSRSARP